MKLKHRILAMLLCALMLLQIFPALSHKVEAATAYTDADWDYLLLKWKSFLCGDENTDWEDPAVQKVVNTVHATTGLSTKGVGYFGGMYWLDLEKNRSNPNRVFGDVDITPDVSSATMSQQLVYLNYMAKAYATYGSEYIYKDENGNKVTLKLYGNPELREAIFYGLEKSLRFYSREQHDAQQSSPNNTANYAWWNWAYQSPLQISEALICTYPYETEKEAALADAASATALEIVNLVRPVATGTTEREVEIRRTRLNICTYLAAVRNDAELMKECQENLIYFLESDPAFHDGVKEDYSYICHRYYAMEGRYGIDVLINRIIDCYSVLAGTAFELKTANRRNQFDWMMNTFKPVMTESGIMAMNNGRVPYCGISMRADVIRGALRLIGCFGEAEDLQLKQFIRSVVVQDTETATKNAYTSHASYLADVNLISLLKEVVMDSSIPEDTEQYAQMRYMTDRAVQHQNGYTVGLAMSSNRIFPYESTNGNNSYGWYSGDGMLYVYMDTDSYNYDPYGDDFWRFANMYRLPSTTEEDSTLRQPIYNRCEYIPGNTYTSKGWVQEKNEYGMDAASFVGGAELKERYIAAAMDFEAYSWTDEESELEIKRIQNNEKSDPYASTHRTKQVLVSDLEAKKSYFMFDDEIVCVGSDINFSTRNNGVNTYVDNRQLLKNAKVDGEMVYGLEDILVDGELLEKSNSFSQPLHYSNPNFVHLESFGGYYFPQGGEVYLNKTHRQTSADGDNTNDDYNAFYQSIKPVTEQHSFFELWISHGKQPKDGSYSYVMLPDKTVAETENYTQNPDVTVLVASDDLHVVRENTLGITAMVFWKAGSYGEITVDQPMIVMVQEQNGIYSVSASDPTHNLTQATIKVNRSLTALSADEEITISGTKETCLQLDLSQNKGKSLEAEFSTEAANYLMFDFNEDNAARYMNSSYGFFDYADAQYWATNNIGGAATTIQDGGMLLPLTTTPNANDVCTTNIEPSDSVKNFASSVNVSKANFLNYDPEQAEIFQIRLKLDGVTHYGKSAAYVAMYYLPEGANKWSGAGNTEASPNPWQEKIFANIDERYTVGGSEDGKYVTLTVSLENTKFRSYDSINGLMLQFANLYGGTVTIDHIYIGPKTHSLYFDFDGSDPSRYNEGAYGGFDFDREENAHWGAAGANAAGNSFSIDNEKGTIKVYVTHDYNGSSSKLYGPYIETTAKAGHYPGKNEAEFPLSYEPQQGQVLQVRFKTENVAAVGQPFLNVLYAGQKDGAIARYSDITGDFTVKNGEYQTLTIPLDGNFEAMDVIHSLGLRFRNVVPEGEKDLGAVEIDYIYVGGLFSLSNSGLFFDYTDTAADRNRYRTATYGMTNFDLTENWTARGALDKNFEIFEGALHLSRTNASGNMSIQTGASSTAFPLHYQPSAEDYCVVRLKLENATGAAKLSLNVFTDTATGANDFKPAGSAAFSAEEMTGEGYFLLSFPLDSEIYKNAKEIVALLPVLSGVQTAETGSPVKVSIDYIYIGADSCLLTGHSYEAVVTPPTCTAAGYTTYTCTVCGDTYIGNEVPATGHVNTSTNTTDATCTEDGSVVVTCACGEVVSTEVVAALGHSYNGTVTAPTCTAAGYTTYTCSRCSDSYVGDEVAALGHSYAYTNNGENHTVTCANACGYEVTEVHAYADGLCVCGAVEITEPILDSSLSFGAQLYLENDLTMAFRVKSSKLANYDLSTAYLVVEREVYETGAKEVTLLTTEIREHTISDDGRVVFSYPGIAAAQMNDAIRATLYIKDASGKEYVSPVLNTSVATYLDGLLGIYANDSKMLTLIMDMLNYGAAAQIYFDRHADALVNEAFESFKTYASYASADFTSVLEDLSATENADGKAGKLNIGLDLGTRIGIQYKVTLPSGIAAEDVSLVIADANGNTLETLALTGEDVTVDSRGRYIISFYGSTSKDMRRVVYATAYANGEAITGTYAYSISTYAWGVQENASAMDTKLVAVTRMMMLYGDSAVAYFG